MDKCKTCKHWTSPSANENWDAASICHPVDPDTYERMKMPFEVRMCESPKIVYFERNPDSTGISLTDASRYYASMLTGEDFGCVNYERRVTSEV